MRTLLALLLSALILLVFSSNSAYSQGQLQERLEELEDLVETQQLQIESLQAFVESISPYISVDQSTINGLEGPHILITGANVHIRSGSGFTDGDGGAPSMGEVNGLGNLIVGYNEVGLDPDPDRGGSHNIILGSGHQYSSFGGFIAGFLNSVTGIYSSVCGGNNNEASGASSSILGGTTNEASGTTSTVSGGGFGEASGTNSSVSGGNMNEASGFASSVSGGSNNVADISNCWRTSIFNDGCTL